MRILNNDSDNALKNVTLYLTLSEIQELRDDLERLIDNPSSSNHAHVADMIYAHEITVVMYDESNLKGLDQRSEKLIQEDV